MSVPLVCRCIVDRFAVGVLLLERDHRSEEIDAQQPRLSALPPKVNLIGRLCRDGLLDLSLKNLERHFPVPDPA